MMRFHPQTLALRRLVQEGAIGEVRLARGVFAFTLERPHDIRFDPDLGGGSIWDLGSYPVSLMRTLLGAEPVEVHGWRRASEQGVDRSFAGHLHFASGAVGQFFSSFEAAPHAEADLLASTGRLHAEVPYATKLGVTMRSRIWRTAQRAEGAFSDSAPFTEETLTFENANAYRDEVESMTASILEGAPQVVPLTESRANVRALEALCESAKTGKPISLDA